jgi:3-hydroxyacyl-CoA dehydrogenase
LARVAIIGSGFIGRAWAISYGRAGNDIVLWDQDAEAPARALDYIDGVLGTLDENGLLDGNSPAEVRARMSAAGSLEAALEGADHVQENAPEAVAVKYELYTRLDALAGADTVLASSTSGILPSAFTEHLEGRARCLVVHPINPPYLVPAAEVVPAPWTDPAVVERTRDFLIAAGHAPIVMKREVDGFVMNRLQGALLQEAFRLVEDGYASVEDVDIGIRDGLALRWSFMGPFETIDLNAPGGVRDYVERYEGLYARMHPSQRRMADWKGALLDGIEADRRAKLPKDKLVERQVWRDRRLMALAAHKRHTTDEIGN